MPPRGTPPLPPSTTRSHPLLIGVTVIVVIAVAVLLVRGVSQTDAPSTALAPSAQTAPPQPQTTTSRAAAPPPAPAPASAAAARPAKPPAKGPLPPLPMLGFVPPRPIDVVQAVFAFAARRPDVLEYVPCFCGCERQGHRGNDDCFVKSRDASGNVEWDPHGMS